MHDNIERQMESCLVLPPAILVQKLYALGSQISNQKKKKKIEKEMEWLESDIVLRSLTFLPFPFSAFHPRTETLIERFSLGVPKWENRCVSRSAIQSIAGWPKQLVLNAGFLTAISYLNVSIDLDLPAAKTQIST